MRLIPLILLFSLVTSCASLNQENKSDIISYHFKNDLKKSFKQDKKITTYYISDNVASISEVLTILKGYYSESIDGTVDMSAASKYYSVELEQALSSKENFDSLEKWNESELVILKKDNVELLYSSSVSTAQKAFYESTKRAAFQENYQLIIYSKPLEIAPNKFAIYTSGKRNDGVVGSPKVYVYKVENNSIELIEEVFDQRRY